MGRLGSRVLPGIQFDLWLARPLTAPMAERASDVRKERGWEQPSGHCAQGSAGMEVGVLTLVLPPRCGGGYTSPPVYWPGCVHATGELLLQTCLASLHILEG